MFGAEYPLVDFQYFPMIFEGFSEIAEVRIKLGEVYI